MTHYVLPIEHLQELSQEILASSDPVVIEDRLRLIIKFYGIYNVDYGYDAPIWRGRKCSGPEGFSNLREVHYPPAAATKPGRLNDSGKPMLYVSMVQFSVLEELQAEAGDFVHYISYGLQKRHVRAAFIGEFTHVQRWGRATLQRRLVRRSTESSRAWSFRLPRLLSSLMPSWRRCCATRMPRRTTTFARVR